MSDLNIKNIKNLDELYNTLGVKKAEDIYTPIASDTIVDGGELEVTANVDTITNNNLVENKLSKRIFAYKDTTSKSAKQKEQANIIDLITKNKFDHENIIDAIYGDKRSNYWYLINTILKDNKTAQTAFKTNIVNYILNKLESMQFPIKQSEYNELIDKKKILDAPGSFSTFLNNILKESKKTNNTVDLDKLGFNTNIVTKYLTILGNIDSKLSMLTSPDTRLGNKSWGAIYSEYKKTNTNKAIPTQTTTLADNFDDVAKMQQQTPITHEQPVAKTQQNIIYDDIKGPYSPKHIEELMNNNELVALGNGILNKQITRSVHGELFLKALAMAVKGSINYMNNFVERIKNFNNFNSVTQEDIDEALAKYGNEQPTQDSRAQSLSSATTNITVDENVLQEFNLTSKDLDAIPTNAFSNDILNTLIGYINETLTKQQTKEKLLEVITKYLDLYGNNPTNDPKTTVKITSLLRELTKRVNKVKINNKSTPKYQQKREKKELENAYIDLGFSENDFAYIKSPTLYKEIARLINEYIKTYNSLTPNEHGVFVDKNGTPIEETELINKYSDLITKAIKNEYEVVKNNPELIKNTEVKKNILPNLEYLLRKREPSVVSSTNSTPIYYSPVIPNEEKIKRINNVFLNQQPITDAILECNNAFTACIEASNGTKLQEVFNQLYTQYWERVEKINNSITKNKPNNDKSPTILGIQDLATYVLTRITDIKNKINYNIQNTKQSNNANILTNILNAIDNLSNTLNNLAKVVSDANNVTQEGNLKPNQTTQPTTQASYMKNLLFVKANLPTIEINKAYVLLNSIANDIASHIQKDIKKTIESDNKGITPTSYTKKLQDNILDNIKQGVLRIGSYINKGKVTEKDVAGVFNYYYSNIKEDSLYNKINFILLKLLQMKLKFLDKATGELEDSTSFNEAMLDPTEDKDQTLYESFNKRSVDAYKIINTDFFLNKSIDTQLKNFKEDIKEYNEPYETKSQGTPNGFMHDVPDLKSLVLKLNKAIEKGKEQYPVFVGDLSQQIKDILNKPENIKYINAIIEESGYPITAKKWIDTIFSWYQKKYNTNLNYNDDTYEKFNQVLEQPIDNETTKLDKIIKKCVKYARGNYSKLINKLNSDKGNYYENLINIVIKKFNDELYKLEKQLDPNTERPNTIGNAWAKGLAKINYDFINAAYRRFKTIVETKEPEQVINDILGISNETEEIEETKEIEQTKETEETKEINLNQSAPIKDEDLVVSFNETEVANKAIADAEKVIQNINNFKEKIKNKNETPTDVVKALINDIILQINNTFIRIMPVYEYVQKDKILSSDSDLKQEVKDTYNMFIRESNIFKESARKYLDEKTDMDVNKKKELFKEYKNLEQLNTPAISNDSVFSDVFSDAEKVEKNSNEINNTYSILTPDIQSALDFTKKYVNDNYETLFPKKYKKLYRFYPFTSQTQVDNNELQAQKDKKLKDNTKEQAAKNRNTVKETRNPLPARHEVGNAKDITFYGTDSISSTPQPDIKYVPSVEAVDDVKLQFVSKVPGFTEELEEIKKLVTDPNSDYNKQTSLLRKKQILNTKIAVLIRNVQNYVKLNYSRELPTLNKWIAQFINNQISK